MLKICFSGLQGSGKTTLCHAITASLRQKRVNAVIAAETARQSMLLWNRQINPEMEAEILGLQLVEESRASLTGDVIICDRGVLDTYACCLARFAGEEHNVIIQAINTFGGFYVNTYNRIFYLENSYSAGSSGDVFRNSDPVTEKAVRKGFEAAIESWNIQVIRLNLLTNPENLVNVIQQLRTDGREGEMVWNLE